MFEMGQDVQIGHDVHIDVKDGFIGNRSIIRDYAVIEGNRVEIGHEAFIDCFAWIGGGSCYNPNTYLKVGDFLHMGRHSHINFALPVEIGHEFGCGMATRVFSHGAYLSAWEGFPVQWASVKIGDSVWMPHAWVNPGVVVGSNVVVAAMSLVNRDLPDGCLAGGIPAKVLKENQYPAILSPCGRAELFKAIFKDASNIARDIEHTFYILPEHFTKFRVIIDDDTIFDIQQRKIEGPATQFTEILKNQLRRNGIRFRYLVKDGEYKPWPEY